MVWRAEIEEYRTKSSALTPCFALTPCWVLGRWESGVGRQAGQRSRLAGLARQVGQGSGVDRGSWGLAWLCWAESEAGGAVGAARAWLGFAGLGPRQVGQVGHVGRLAGFVGAGRSSSRPGQSGQVGLEGRLAWLGRARLGFAGLGPRQVAAGGAGAWLGFAGLGPRQVAGRAGQPGLGLALLGWVLGRWQAGQGRGLGFAGLGPRQAAVRAEGYAGAAGAQLGFAGLGLRQAAAGQWGRQGQPGLGLALLGWVLGRWQARLGFAGLGPRQVAAGWLGWADGAGRTPGQMGQVGHVGRLAGLAGQFGQVGAAGGAGARLGFAGLGPRQGRWAWLGFAELGPRQVRMGRLGRWSRSVGKGRADWLVLQNELEFDQIALLVTSSYYEDIEGDEGTALGSWRAFALRGSRINVGVTEGRLRFCYIGATVTRIEILISAIYRGGIRLGVIGLAVAAAQVKQTLDPSTKTLANVDGIKWFDDELDGPGSADSAKDGLKRLLSHEDSGGSIGIKGDRGGRYIRREPSAEEELSPAGFGRWAGKISQEVSQMGLGAIPGWRVAGNDDETPPAFSPNLSLTSIRVLSNNPGDVIGVQPILNRQTDL
ncbi:hypothetical protein BY996DRAFT_6463980 [Phakopsora pachyrhizi]|nr:hypothetical protein BY996DRAFT_6463980 [Phakopsora pachyrhizi]